MQDAGNLRELVTRLQEGIYVTNAAGDFLDANPALLQALGVANLEELRRHKITDFIDSELRTWKMKRMERDGFVRDLELQIRRADGSTRTVLDTAFMQSAAASGEIFCCGILVDISERKQLETQLKEQAVRDPLTGCLNRRYLSMLEITGEGMPGSWGCLVIDVDHFKDYNDRYGHETGDQVLVKLAHFLMRQVRAEEAVIRTGGDEFLIVMTHADASHTEAAARRLEAAARAEYMCRSLWDGQPASATSCWKRPLPAPTRNSMPCAPPRAVRSANGGADRLSTAAKAVSLVCCFSWA